MDTGKPTFAKTTTAPQISAGKGYVLAALGHLFELDGLGDVPVHLLIMPGLAILCLQLSWTCWNDWRS